MEIPISGGSRGAFIVNMTKCLKHKHQLGYLMVIVIFYCFPFFSFLLFLDVALHLCPSDRGKIFEITFTSRIPDAKSAPVHKLAKRLNSW